MPLPLYDTPDSELVHDDSRTLSLQGIGIKDTYITNHSLVPRLSKGGGGKESLVHTVCARL